MDPIKLHLLINHFPIITSFIGVVILVIGYILKTKIIRLTAIGILIFTGVTSIIAHKTGERAEDPVEEIHGIDHHLIHEHEELGESTTIPSLLLIVLGVGAFIFKDRENYLKRLPLLVLLIGVVLCLMLFEVGESGGKIRRELKPSAPSSQESFIGEVSPLCIL